MRATVAGLLLALSAPMAPLAPVAPAAPGVADRADARAADAGHRAAPGLRVTTFAAGLDHPWDVHPLGGGRALVTERDTARLWVVGKGGKHRVRFPSTKVWVSGETGLMGLEVDPGFAKNRRFYTCMGGFPVGGGTDVRVVTWRFTDKALTRARMVRVLLSGIPTSSGRHGGCRLLITRNGSLLVGTGDAAVGTNPQRLGSLGGKTLRLHRVTGDPWPSNPFVDGKGKRRFVFTYGHRNVQGLAERADGTLWSVEHGSFRDDEVNRLVRGGNYGWHPVPGYDESVPMTDHSLPGKQRSARWSSGEPTLATSGAAWVRGKDWRGLNGRLAVACLKASRVLFIRFDAKGRLKSVRAPKALRQYGRLRSVSRAPDGSLLITTDNGGGNDAVLKVRPR